MDRPTVQIKQGQLKGSLFKTENNFEYFGFLKVPYAKPPVGELRFKAPQLPESWEGERDATLEPSLDGICLQINTATGLVSGSEDCLYLNVYTPKVTEQSKLSVLVYIHGGGFVFGDGTIKDENGPDYLIEQDVVVVSVNYRLGIFGFLCLDIPEAQGNMGLKDQVQALKWVKENIASFGGDPTNITLFGISAGGSSIDYLLVSPMARNLFHKAILQSGAAINPWARNYKHKKHAMDIAKHLGYKSSDDDSTKIYQFLNDKTVEELVKSAFEVAQSVMDQGLYFGLVPTIEKEFENTEAFLSEDSYKLLKDGHFSKIPTIRGFCRFEGLIMNAMKPSLVEKTIESKDFAVNLPYKIDSFEDINNELRSIYLGNALPDDEFDKFALQFYSDLDFTAGIWTSGKVQADHSAPVYMYEFAYDGTNNYFKATFGIMRPGTCHGDDSSYTMYVKRFISKRSETDKKVCYHFARLWTNFAKNGNPNPVVVVDASTEWLPFTRDQTNYLVIDETLTLKSNYESRRLEFFEGLYEKYESVS